MTEHMSESWSRWREILSYLQTIDRPITWDDIVTGNSVDGYSIIDLTQELWSFICRHIAGHVYDRRRTYGFNIVGNGFELWRKLYREYEGTSELMHLHGQTFFWHFHSATTTENSALTLTIGSSCFRNSAMACRSHR